MEKQRKYGDDDVVNGPSHHCVRFPGSPASPVSTELAREKVTRKDYQLTARLFSLKFLMRLDVHSPAVESGSYWPTGAVATLSAISGLFSARWCRRTSSPGRVKNAIEYRAYRDCSPGGGL